MIAKSIVKKKDEINNIIELNTEKFENSPYQNKQMKVKPNIIYVKDNKDQLFLMSEGKKNVRTYSSSHYNVYGKRVLQPKRFNCDSERTIMDQ